MLLNAINEITDNVKADTEKKLEDFVRRNAFDDLIKENAGLFRRVQNLEKSRDEMDETLTENKEKIDTNRKSAQRNAKDIEILKKQLASGDFKMPDKEDSDEEVALDGDIGADAVAKLQLQITRMEKQLI